MKYFISISTMALITLIGCGKEEKNSSQLQTVDQCQPQSKYHGNGPSGSGAGDDLGAAGAGKNAGGSIGGAGGADYPGAGGAGKSAGGSIGGAGGADYPGAGGAGKQAWEEYQVPKSGGGAVGAGSAGSGSGGASNAKYYQGENEGC